MTILRTLKRQLVIERLRLENAVIKYGDLTVIKNASLRAYGGEMIFITGANGSGKSTLIRGIAGLLPLTSGSLKRFGRVSYVPQIEEADKNFPATVREIVMTGTQRTGKLFYSQKDRNTAEKFMNVLGVSEFSNREMKTLSGGQLRRVFLARALCGNPELLLLDEPCAGLDSESHKILFGTLEKVLAENCAVIMVTHDDSDLDGIENSRIIEISEGEIHE